MVKKYLFLFVALVILFGCINQESNNQSTIDLNSNENQVENLTLILDKEQFSIYELNKTEQISQFVKEACQLEGNYNGYAYFHDLNKNNGNEVVYEGFYFTSTHLFKYDPKQDIAELVFEVEENARILHACIINDDLIYYSKVKYKPLEDNPDFLIPYVQIIKWENGQEFILDEYDTVNSTDGAEILAINNKVYYSKAAIDYKNDAYEYAIIEIGCKEPIWYYTTPTSNMNEDAFYLSLNHASYSDEYIAFTYSSQKESHIIYSNGNEINNIKIDGRIDLIAVVEDKIIFDGTVQGVLNCANETITELDHHPHLARVCTGDNGVFVGSSNFESYITIQRLIDNHLQVQLIYELGSNTTYTYEHIADNEFLIHFNEFHEDDNGVPYRKHKLYLLKVKDIE